MSTEHATDLINPELNAPATVSPLTSGASASYLTDEGGSPPRPVPRPSEPPQAVSPHHAKPQGKASMATSPESSGPAKDVRGLSAILNEISLEASILRRGLATPQEIEACKALRAKLAAAATATNKEDPGKSLLEVMVEAKVITKNQSLRLAKEGGPEPVKTLSIPGYQLISKLGKGSMGIVYKAKQTSVDRIVAVKVLLEPLAKNKDFIKRFEREAKIAAKLSHNNIVNAIDAGNVDGHHFFVMEYVEGATIKDELDKNKIFDEKVALRIISAVAEALKHAHQRGLIHRDIKPENIILCKDGNVKLADLGLARLTADEKWAMAEVGMAIGTPYYISPEQVRGLVDVDIRADIYGLGATLYHMITGKVPFGGDTPNEVMKKHVDKNVSLVPPDHLNTKLSSGIGMVVETMMARDRNNRYATPDDVLLDLRCLLQGEPPMIAGQKLDSLASLAEGDTSDSAEASSAVTDAEKAEMAAKVNSKNTLVVILGILLGMSVLTNVLLLLVK